MTDNSNDKSTRSKLIEAAGELFAEKGFKGTTVREICEQAGTNVASVNYHFGDKEKLYQEVLAHIVANVRDKFTMEALVRPEDHPRDRLYSFIYTFLMRRFDPERADWQNILLYKEWMEPRTVALTHMHDERIQDQQILERIILDLAGEQIDPMRLMLVSMSVVGQCLFYIMLHAPPSPIPEEERIPMDEGNLLAVASHITEFSIAGIERIKNRLK